MKNSKTTLVLAALGAALWPGCAPDRTQAPMPTPKESAAPALAVPRFSTHYMDTSVAPGADFFRYADGAWLKANPVPADKSRWSAFDELQERNWHLIHDILDSTLTNRSALAHSP